MPREDEPLDSSILYVIVEGGIHSPLSRCFWTPMDSPKIIWTCRRTLISLLIAMFGVDVVPNLKGEMAF